MKKLLTFLLCIISLSVFSQTQIDPAASPTVARINAAIRGSIVASGTNTYTGALALTGITTYTGLAFNVTFTNANSGASTFNLNNGTSNLGPVAIKKYSSGSLVDIATGDIFAGETKRLRYNGTFLVIEPAPSSGGGGGGGTVTTVSVVTANGVSGSVANPSTTPAITLLLGAIVPSSVNGVTISGSSSPTLAVTGASSISGANNGDQTVTLTSDVTGSGTGSFATTIANNAVTYAKFQQAGSGMSVLGRGPNSSGNYAEITAGFDFEVMRRNGSGIGFGSINLASVNTVGSSLLRLNNGGVNADLSATGGAGQYLKQSSSGAAITVGTIAASDIASGAALTKVDDTNVTATLGGVPTTALLNAASITLGWNGTLAYSRFVNGGGLSVVGRSANSSGVQADITGTTDQVFRVNGAGTSLGFGSIDLSKSATVGSSILPIANGGTNASSAGITAFNNITGYTASGATGTTSTNLVFSASPTLTGIPAAPTPTAGTNTTQIATTAFVNTAIIAGAVGGYVTPEQYGAVGDGSTNDQAALQSCVNTGACYLGLKNYRTNTTVNVPTGASVTGAGPGSIVSTTSNISVFTVIGKNINFKDFSITGNSSGAVQRGIDVTGNVGLTLDYTTIHVTSVNFNTLGQAGIYVTNVLGHSGSFHEGSIYAVSCFANTCGTGYYLDTRAEYCNFINCTAYACVTGLRLVGGNNIFSGGTIVDCTSGINCAAGTNDGKCIISGNKFNHNGTVLTSAAVSSLGSYFTNNTFAANTSMTITSSPHRFQGNTFGNMTINIVNSGTSEWINNKFLSATASVVLTGTKPIVFGNTFDSGVIAAALNDNTLSGFLGMGVAPTSRLELAAGSATANTAPIELNSGQLETVIRSGVIEFDNAHYESNAALNRYGKGGPIKDFVADVANTSTTETDLFTYTTKASTLSATGEKLNFDLSGQLSDITSTAQLRFYFAGTSFGDTGAITIGATGGWTARCRIIRTGSTTARASVEASFQGTTYSMETDLTGITFTNTNIIKVTGQAGGAGGGSNDITAKEGVVYWWPAANN